MNDLLKNRLLLKRKLADINITKFNFHSENQISEDGLSLTNQSKQNDDSVEN